MSNTGAQRSFSLWASCAVSYCPITALVFPSVNQSMFLRLLMFSDSFSSSALTRITVPSHPSLCSGRISQSLVLKIQCEKPSPSYSLQKNNNNNKNNNNIVTTIFKDMNSGNLTYCQLSIIYIPLQDSTLLFLLLIFCCSLRGVYIC